MIKNIANHARNINEIFIDIFMVILLGYIVYYHHGNDQHVMKNE